MPRGVFLMIALAQCALANATDWELVQKNDANGASAWIDPASIKGKGARRSAWTLWDYPQAQSVLSAKPYRSTKDHLLYDCKERKYALLESIAYDGNRGEGKSELLHKVDASQARFLDVSSQVLDQSVIRRVCRAGAPPPPAKG